MNVLNAIFRLEQVSGTPPAPWEVPSELAGFWALELSSHPEPLLDWQKRIIPLISGQRGFILSHVVNGAKTALFVETESPQLSPAVFGPDLIELLSDLSASLEHSIEQP